MSAQQLKIRRVVWTGAIAAVTVTGAWYGAGLKTQSDTQQMVQKRLEATMEEKLAQLEMQRDGLVRAKMSLEKKLADLEVRMEKKAKAERANAAKGT